MRRYTAKLLYIWNPDPETGSRRRRYCEERMVTFESRSSSEAVKKAKSLGKTNELHYDSGERLRFAGILECMELGLESEEYDVWWDMVRRTNPERWARRVIPPVSRLRVFTEEKRTARSTKSRRRRTR